MSTRRYHPRPCTVPAAGLAGEMTVTLCLGGLVLLLPWLLPQRTPELLALSGLVLLGAALVAALGASLARFNERADFGLPGTGWWAVFGIVSAVVLLQVMPITSLARWFGPYPETFWQLEQFEPRTWSPNPAASIRGWAVFAALFTLAWLAGQLRDTHRNWIWLAVAMAATLQAGYGLLAHSVGLEMGIANEVEGRSRALQGSFSNRNLFAAYLALSWPLVVAVWWLRDMPLIGSLPRELRITGSLLAGSIVGAAIFASASRLGAMAGVFGAVAGVLLLTRYRGRLTGFALWPASLVLLGTFIVAVWIGLEPLTGRLAATDAEEYRLVAFALMFREFPWSWWLHGVGLGGFEAVFKLIQTDQVSGWWDYAHSDLIQWTLEMGLPGVIVLALVIGGLITRFGLTLERIPLYAGLLALAVVALGDFSWHLPATQVVLAIYIGVLLQPARNGHREGARGRHEKVDEGRPVRRRRRRRSGGLRQDLLN